MGGPVKNTVCITRGDEAFISQNIGELSNPAAFAGFEKTITHLLKMLEVTPTLLAHDLFRDSYSSAVVEGMARQYNIPMLAIQHHHAHIAAVLAEHRLTCAPYGLALDGGEPGLDGSCWGGELLLVDVRPPEERAIAALPVPHKTFDGNGRAELEALPKDTALAFVCHHGGRSQQAAEEFRARGFTGVFNVTGGIDAWAADVDASIPRY